MPTISESKSIALKKIMFATDFSAIAEKTAAYAMGLAHRFGATLQIAHVFQPDLFLEGDDPSVPSKTGDSRRKRQENIIRLQQIFSDAGIKTWTRISDGYPVWTGLLQLAAEEASDLLVLGTQAKSEFDRLTIGSTAEHIIRMAKCPVMTIGPHAKSPSEGPFFTFRNVLVATDFSPASLKAARYGAWLAKDSGAVLHLLHIEDSRSARPVNLRSSEECDSEWKRLISDGMDNEDWPECRAAYGEVAETILNQAINVQADLIVLGARKNSFWQTYVKRGVTVNVLAKATCPVLSTCLIKRVRSTSAN